MNPFLAWLPLISAGLPEVIDLVKAVLALRQKYPELTPDQLNALIATITGTGDAAFDSALAKIAIDQAAHPV